QRAVKLRAVDLAERKAIAAEHVDALKSQQAQLAAERAIATEQIRVDTLGERAALVPAETRRRQDAIHVALADHLQTIAAGGAARTTAHAAIAARRQAAADATAAARDALERELASQKVELERQIERNRPRPPG